jgi:hypothetical protein
MVFFGPATGEELTLRVKQNLARTTGKWHILQDTCESLKSIPDQLFTPGKKEDYG